MPANTAAALAYVLGLITGIVMLAVQREDKYVHFHAVQSIGLSVVWVVGWLFLTIVPVLGWLLLPFWGLLMFVLWLVCIVKAFQGEKFELPVIGASIQRVGKQVGL
jgi:uncharacterized membrane protein